MGNLADTYFRFTLTGSADATTDVTLPLQNLTARLRSGSPSYLSVTIPYTDSYAAAVTARPNGDLQLQHISRADDGTETPTAVTDVAFDRSQISKGAGSSSIVLSGNRQTTNSTPTSHTVQATSTQTGTSRTAIVPGFNPAIAAADDITADSITFTVGTVVLQASPSNIQTQYVEA